MNDDESIVCRSSITYETCGRASVLAALRVQREQLARQHSRQAVVFVGRVEETRGRVTVEEVMEAGNGAGRPAESSVRVSQVAHYVPVFPAAFFSSRTAEVRRRRATVVHRSQQMTDFVRRDDDSTESSRIFDDGHRINLLEPFVDDARASDVREPCNRRTRSC